jgi:hypothetical protein
MSYYVPDSGCVVLTIESSARKKIQDYRNERGMLSNVLVRKRLSRETILEQSEGGVSHEV